MIECPRHNGAFDCSPFCEVCEGQNEYNPADTLGCVVPDCTETIAKDLWLEESGFCVEHSHAYYNQELNPFTLERDSKAVWDVALVLNRARILVTTEAKDYSEAHAKAVEILAEEIGTNLIAEKIRYQIEIESA